MSMPIEYRKVEFVGLRLTRAEKRDLETLMRHLQMNKTDSLKYALNYAVKTLPRIRRPIMPRRKAAV